MHRFKKYLSLLFFYLLLIFTTNNSFALDSNQDSTINQKAEIIEDPDLKLSIEELRKKYPIDWLSRKYGNVSGENCVTAGSYDIDEVDAWPCGPICSKYPEQKECPKKCHKHKKGVNSKNLICSFFKTKYQKEYKNNSYSLKPITTPVARFEDFSIDEIKSAFVYYNNPDNFFDKAELSDHRAREIVGIVFIHFLNDSGALQNNKARLLKNFIFSKKVSNGFKIDKNQCEVFRDYLIGPSISRKEAATFCLLF